MNTVLKGYLRLMRPANLPTAVADILAGAALSGVLANSFPDYNLFFLVFASIFLYAGGVVLNDVFDFEIDKIERPERPISSGLIPKKSAATFGVVLLAKGVFLAFLVNQLSGFVALTLAIAIVLYDAFAKNHEFFGPLNMGLCRALNLILGMSIIGEIFNAWYAIIPLVYIFAITLISRGEVHGNNKRHIIWAGILYAIVISTVLIFVVTQTSNLWQTIPFLFLFMFLVYRPLIHAYKQNSPEHIKKAVIAGVLSMIVLDAALVVGFSDWRYGLVLLLLLPLSVFLSKLFAVT
jgi:4-hydroxybenzoate polyprenyltransferase